jgi:hypothetical protein
MRGCLLWLFLVLALAKAKSQKKPQQTPYFTNMRSMHMVGFGGETVIAGG